MSRDEGVGKSEKTEKRERKTLRNRNKEQGRQKGIE
jgi:hypothetical protein